MQVDDTDAGRIIFVYPRRVTKVSRRFLRPVAPAAAPSPVKRARVEKSSSQVSVMLSPERLPDSFTRFLENRRSQD